MADSTDGWMLIAGGAGLGGLEEMLATTSDGGRHWTKAKASGMSIGRNAAQLLIVRSATEAWFASLHYEKDEPLVMAHTVDSGQNWEMDTSFRQGYPWCDSCITGSELIAGGDHSHSGGVRFGALLETDASGGSSRGHAQYCLLPNGQSWSVPERISEPGRFLGSDLTRYGRFPLFADGELSFAETCIEAPVPPGGSACNIYQTLDQGKTWQLAGKLPAVSGMHLKQVEESGDLSGS